MSEYGEFTPFIEAMKSEYLRHYPEKGDSWKQEGRFRVPGSSDEYPQYIDQNGYLRNVLLNCVKKYWRTKDPSELVDISLMCGMLWMRTSDKTGEST